MTFRAIAALAITATLVHLAASAPQKRWYPGTLNIMPQERRTCQVFNFTICNQIGYNTTSLPNKRNHTTIEKAADELSDFMQVMSSKCSRYVVTLFCFTYFPFCDTTQWENLDVYDKNDYEPIYPCQDACRTVTSECREEFERQSGGYEWPRVFQNCNTFPETNCAIGPDPEEPTDAGPTDGDGDVTPTEVEPVTSNPTPTQRLPDCSKIQQCDYRTKCTANFFKRKDHNFGKYDCFPSLQRIYRPN